MVLRLSFTYLALLLWLNTAVAIGNGQYDLVVGSANEIQQREHIDFQVKSWPVDIVGSESATSIFGEELESKYNSIIQSNMYATDKEKELKTGFPRGIPPSNWVKFIGHDGVTYGLFAFKSMNRCDATRLGDPLYDSVNLNQLRTSFGDKDYYTTRTVVAVQLHTHSLTSRATEAYHLKMVYHNFTHLPGAHSDVRIIKFARDRCGEVLSTVPGMADAHYVVAGAAHSSGWQEKQFVGVLDAGFRLLKSWVLYDASLPMMNNGRVKSQKNWLPFWDEDQCLLLLSKRYAPEHTVSAFREWHATLPYENGAGAEAEVGVEFGRAGYEGERGKGPNLRPNAEHLKPEVTDKGVFNETVLRNPFRDVGLLNYAQAPSPASVPSKYFVRGSAPVISHPRLLDGISIGCVHVRGRFKVYRHALFLQSTRFPYKIVSFSPLFAFEPYRDIEFVMGLVLRSAESGNTYDDYGIELSYGSLDCEPRIAVIAWSTLKSMFREFVRPEYR